MLRRFYEDIIVVERRYYRYEDIIEDFTKILSQFFSFSGKPLSNCIDVTLKERP